MKYLPLTACCLGLATTAIFASENLVQNGDFESGEGTAFYQTQPWYNRGEGLNQGANARNDQRGLITGSYSASVNDRFKTGEGKFGPLAYVQNTGYEIQPGDVFELYYEWRPSDEHWQRQRDTIRFVLYATANDRVGGELVWSSELTSDFFKLKPTEVMSVSQVTEEVPSEAIGRKLFVLFYGLDTIDSEQGEPHWARVDNIEVKVAKK